MVDSPGIRDMAASYGELALAQQPTIELLESLGWKHRDLFSEVLGPDGTEGRESKHQVILTRRLLAALPRLNPGIPVDACAQAVEQLAADRSRQLPVDANREVYKLLKDSVKVSLPDEHGGQTVETLRVIDRNRAVNNDLFVASEIWAAGDI